MPRHATPRHFHFRFQQQVFLFDREICTIKTRVAHTHQICGLRSFIVVSIELAKRKGAKKGNKGKRRERERETHTERRGRGGRGGGGIKPPAKPQFFNRPRPNGPSIEVSGSVCPCVSGKPKQVPKRQTGYAWECPNIAEPNQGLPPPPPLPKKRKKEKVGSQLNTQFDPPLKFPPPGDAPTALLGYKCC